MARAEHTVERRAFEFKRCLGRCGFGEVYLASMTSAGGVRAEVAVKVLVADLDVRSQAVQRLRDEGRLLGALNHPSILRVHDIVLLEDRVALVTEYIDGADLSTLIRGTDRMPARALTEVVARVADALHAAWTAPSPDGGEMRLVHRDIKPPNIRIGKHGDVKVLDFGIAKATNDNVDREAHTQTNMVIGSIGFIAPERMFSEGVIEPSGDVFALGCVLYEGLAGEKFFHRQDEKKMYRLALDGDEYTAYLSERLDKIRGCRAHLGLVVAMLAYLPENRPTARDVASLCEHLAEDLGGIGLKRWCRELRWPDGKHLDGALDGRVITEATLARSSPKLPQARPVPAPAPPIEPVTGSLTRSSTAPLVATGALVLTAGGTAALAALVVVAVLGLWLATRPVASAPPPAPAAVEPAPEPKPAKRPTIGAKPAPKPVEAAVPKPAPAPAPAPAAVPARAKAGAPVAVPPVPVPAAPAPVEPAVTVDATGTVRVEGGVPVELVKGGKAHPPGALAPGVYEIRADFGKGMGPAGAADLRSGATVVVRCSKLRQSCTVEGG